MRQPTHRLRPGTIHASLGHARYRGYRCVCLPIGGPMFEYDARITLPIACPAPLKAFPEVP